MDAAEIKERLREAADVLRRLPPVRGPKSYGSNWPGIVRDTVGALWRFDPTLGRWVREVPPVSPVVPFGAEIDRMDEALQWLCWVRDEAETERLVQSHHHEKQDAEICLARRQKIIWLRANRVHWETIRLRLHRSVTALKTDQCDGLACISRRVLEKAA